MQYHFCQASCGDNVPGMHEAIQVPRRLLDGLAHLIVALEVKDIGDEIQGILVILDFRVKARQVEPVGEVVFVDFAKVLVAARGYELWAGAGRGPLANCFLIIMYGGMRQESIAERGREGEKE